MSTSDMPFAPSSCELGISGASLLGAGVMFVATDFLTTDLILLLKELLEAWVPLLFSEELTVDWEPLGGPLEKKPRMDDCLLLEPALEFCFLREGGGRAGVASPAWTLAMVQIAVATSS